MDCSPIDRGLNPLLTKLRGVFTYKIANLKTQANSLPGLSPAYYAAARRGKVDGCSLVWALSC